MADKRSKSWLFYLDQERPCIIIAESNLPADIFNLSNEHLPDSAPIVIEKVVSCGKTTAILPLLQKHNRGNELFFFFFKKRMIGNLQKILRNNHLSILTHIIAVPRLDKPRWYFPANKTIIHNAGNIIKPTKLKASLAWKLMGLLNTAGLSHWLFPEQVIIAERKSCKQEYLGALAAHLSAHAALRMRDLEFILYTGAYGIYQKWTAQIMDANGSVVAFAKIGTSRKAIKRLENETRTLEKLRHYTFSRVSFPEVRSYTGDNLNLGAILIQSPADPRYKIIYRKLNSSHLKALIDLALQTTKTVNDVHVSARLKQAGAAITNIQPGSKNIINQTLASIKQRIEDNNIPVSLSHGDFSPWNSFFADDGQMFLIDWELSGQRIWLWDYFNFIFHTTVLIDEKINTQAAATMLDACGIKTNTFRQHCPPEALFNPQLFLLICTLELLEYYVVYRQEQQKAGFDPDPEINRMISSLEAILHMANKKRLRS